VHGKPLAQYSVKYMSNILNLVFKTMALEQQYAYFQQENAAACTSYKSVAATCEMFDNTIIGQGLWPPTSSYPSYCDYPTMTLRKKCTRITFALLKPYTMK
jgi:hypothetical protein